MENIVTRPVFQKDKYFFFMFLSFCSIINWIYVSLMALNLRRRKKRKLSLQHEICTIFLVQVRRFHLCVASPYTNHQAASAKSEKNFNSIKIQGAVYPSFPFFVTSRGDELNKCTNFGQNSRFIDNSFVKRQAIAHLCNKNYSHFFSVRKRKPLQIDFC